MPKKALGLMSLALAVLALNATAFAQQKFSTTIYFDYFFNLTNNGYLTGTTAAKALNNAFRFRRAYFRYDNKISDVLSFRMTFDADNTANLTGVTFTGNPPVVATKVDDKLRPFIKHLYLDYAGLLPNSSFRVGMVNTITFQIEEDKWGYRSVAKTLLDIYKDITGVNIRASSADIGINFTGMATKELRYGLMVTNGEGYSHPELNKYKKIGGYVQVIPVAGLSLVGYVDYEPLDPSNHALTYKADAYLEMIPNLTVGGSWFSYNNDLFKNADLSHYNAGGYSIFGVYKIVPDNLNAFARLDHYIPNSTNAELNQGLVILGLDWAPVSTTWKIQPNVLIQTYGSDAKKTDATAQMTFFLSF
jgi:hypothetical protein